MYDDALSGISTRSLLEVEMFLFLQTAAVRLAHYLVSLFVPDWASWVRL